MTPKITIEVLTLYGPVISHDLSAHTVRVKTSRRAPADDPGSGQMSLKIRLKAHSPVGFLATMLTEAEACCLDHLCYLCAKTSKKKMCRRVQTHRWPIICSCFWRNKRIFSFSVAWAACLFNCAARARKALHFSPSLTGPVLPTGLGLGCGLIFMSLAQTWPGQVC